MCYLTKAAIARRSPRDRQPNNAVCPPHSAVTARAHGGRCRAAGRAGCAGRRADETVIPCRSQRDRQATCTARARDSRRPTWHE